MIIWGLPKCHNIMESYINSRSLNCKQNNSGDNDNLRPNLKETVPQCGCWMVAEHLWEKSSTVEYYFKCTFVLETQLCFWSEGGLCMRLYWGGCTKTPPSTRKDAPKKYSLSLGLWTKSDKWKTNPSTTRYLFKTNMQEFKTKHKGKWSEGWGGRRMTPLIKNLLFYTETPQGGPEIALCKKSLGGGLLSRRWSYVRCGASAFNRLLALVGWSRLCCLV